MVVAATALALAGLGSPVLASSNERRGIYVKDATGTVRIEGVKDLRIDHLTATSDYQG